MYVDGTNLIHAAPGYSTDIPFRVDVGDAGGPRNGRLARSHPINIYPPQSDSEL